MSCFICEQETFATLAAAFKIARHEAFGFADEVDFVGRLLSANEKAFKERYGEDSGTNLLNIPGSAWQMLIEEAENRLRAMPEHEAGALVRRMASCLNYQCYDWSGWTSDSARKQLMETIFEWSDAMARHIEAQADFTYNWG